MGIFTWFALRKISKKDRDKVLAALANYPVYAPPIPRRIYKKSDAYKNFQYFLATRQERQAALGRFFDAFGLSLRFEPQALYDVSAWVHRYGIHLVNVDASVDVNICARDYKPKWTGELKVINVMYDIGTYFGEYICHNNENAKWVLDVPEAREFKDALGAFMPAVDGLHKLVKRPLDIHVITIHACEISMSVKIQGPVSGSTYSKDDGLARFIEYATEQNPEGYFQG
jgi:hypothetical protein